MAEENRLGTMPIGKLLTVMSLPIVCSMLVQALYNVVDSIFVAQYSEQALTAVSLAFPIQNLMIAFGAGTGVGVGSLISRRLGEKNLESANRAAKNGIFLTICNWLLFLVFGLVGTSLFFASYANNPEIGPEIAALGGEYMRIVTIGSLGIFGGILFERFLQSTGRSTLSMVSQMTGAVVNIILDPILIFGYFGLPSMGVAGAAIATVIGQWVGMFTALALNLLRNKELRFSFKGFRPSAKTIKHIYQVGLPTIVMQSIGSVMTYAMNIILAAFGAIPVSVFGIYFKLQSFVFMPVFGFNNGMVPIIAYNFGAKRPARIKETVKKAMVINTGIMVAGMLLFWLATDWLLTLFNAEAEMLEVGRYALRFISLSFPIAAVSITITGFFQSTGEGLYSLINSVVRQLVFLLPMAWALARLQGLNAIWFAFPIAELFAMVLVIYLFRRTWSHRISPLQKTA